MTGGADKPPLEVKLGLRELPEDVKRNRERYRKENERLEDIARPRMQAQLHACRIALEQLKDWHRHVAETTSYVRPKTAREAQERFEDKLDEAMRKQGLPSLGRTGPLVNEVYDRMSRVAHSRRSTCVSSVSEPLREFAYGRHPSPIRRAIVVEWTSSMTVEVLNAVGDVLRAFFGPGFFVDKVAPLRQSVEAIRSTSPLDADSIIAAAS